MSEWIRVYDKLPNDGETVWATSGGRYVALADFQAPITFFEVGSSDVIVGVTEWAPLDVPEPPA